MEILVIGVGGFCGAVARYGLSALVLRHYDGPFPAGTLVVNVLGCLMIGVLMTLVQERELFGPSTRRFLMIGFLGSLTTFSTLGWETLELLRDSQVGLAVASVLANAIVGVGAVVAGAYGAKLCGA